jgi:methylenetetrahydrofolate dehydrogenase (NADP+)/methenyltetrahydrofolate cyclohydrolase
MVKILDGVKTSNEIKNEIKEQLKNQMIKPCLAVVLCSDDPASEIYVSKKIKACAEVGIESQLYKCGKFGNDHDSITKVIQTLNNNPSVHGILVQLPLPNGMSPYPIFDLINPKKDVDVFSPTNVGLLLQGRPRFIPCTPQAVQELLVRNGITIAGTKVCIINRSDIVGKPLHALLIQNCEQANATVCICHDHTPPERLRSICLSSDIIVVAVGKPKFLTEDMVPEGGIVVDVGITRISDSKKIVGDVDFDAVAKKCSWISPVPNGVGPCTVACLLKNVVKAYNLQRNDKVH